MHMQMYAYGCKFELSSQSQMVADATAASYFNMEDECKKNRARRPRRIWIHDIASRRLVTVKSDFRRINTIYLGPVACFRCGGLVSGCSVPVTHGNRPI